MKACTMAPFTCIGVVSRQRVHRLAADYIRLNEGDMSPVGPKRSATFKTVSPGYVSTSLNCRG